ncbi:MAG: extracellular solute-binding protein [Alphaproteobacteria bacterium]|nr:MAG: extracellular solute-binding protein [Alphaproteobacteria bacterium]
MTQRAAKAFTRRVLLQSAAAAGVLSVGAPWIAKRALSSSGEVNVYAWSDYIWPEMIEPFEKKTGIKVNLSKYGSNDELLTKLKTSGGKGFDLVFPSVDTGPTWYQSGDLLQPLDLKKINVDAIIPSLWEKSKELGAVFRRKRYLCPFDWGTEAMTFDSSKRDYKYGTMSYGDLWSEENKGLITVRQKSALITLGLYFDRTGQVPSNRLRDLYEDETTAREIYEKILPFAIEHKSWVRQFWNNTQETLNAFYQNNCIAGQCWDGPSMRMMKETKGRIRYLMPVEGGLAWLDTMAIPSGAENVEQAYAFINHLLTPEMGGILGNKAGYNSAVKGAADFLEPESREAFKSAYPGDAIDNLWWWLPSPAWWAALRAEYVDKWNAA